MSFALLCDAHWCCLTTNDITLRLQNLLNRAITDLKIYTGADRASGISGVYGTQIIPTGDPKSIELFSEFEKSVYDKVRIKD